VGPFDEIRAQRFAFLRAVYDETEGSTDRLLNMNEVGAELGFDEQLTDKITTYLVNEHLLEWAGLGGFIELTHWGLKEVEEVLSAPTEPTEHFPSLVVAQNYINVASMHDSQIQQGTEGSVQTQVPVNIDQLRDLVEQISNEAEALDLADDDRRELEASIGTANAQLDSSRPNHSILRESLSSAQRILEGAAGSGVAIALPQLIETLGHVIASL
jgi:hypothetical protein